MTAEIAYECYNERASQSYPKHSHVCCGWCYNVPTTFYGTWGPLLRSVVPSACGAIPLVSQPLTLTRTGNCPPFSWGGAANTYLSLFLKVYAPICPKNSLNPEEFKMKWAALNCFDLTGYCGPDANGTVQFYCAGTVLYPCEFRFEITSWSY